MDDIPPLYLETLESHDDKVTGLHLVADSIAQMSQQAARTLVFHPLCLACLVAALAAAYRFGYRSHKDLGTAIVLSCGVIAAYLVAIRFVASGYLVQAEKMRYSWLQADDGVEDLVIGARFDNAIVGALVLRLKRPSPPSTPAGKKKNHRGAGPKMGGQGVVRAWTTKLRYRGQGVGRDLLIEAVRVTKERCGRDAEVGFAKEHANSVKVLPEMFNGVFRRSEKQATRALHDVLSEWEAMKKKR
jgi:ribosomal protein S18 acetylase RimI-like enzyme